MRRAGGGFVGVPVRREGGVSNKSEGTFCDTRGDLTLFGAREDVQLDVELRRLRTSLGAVFDTNTNPPAAVLGKRTPMMRYACWILPFVICVCAGAGSVDTKAGGGGYIRRLCV